MSERDAIEALDDTTVERIAAGEVVERPASAVKELLENSLDADASRVRVAIDSGGKDAITVSDDGLGMTESQVRTAVREHTTSKIRDIDDLEGGVATLGFRGEALHAIGAVSRMTITTRPRGGDRGTRLQVAGGDVTTVEAAGCPEGTTVEIEDLFYNVPARRKYLSQETTEFDHVNTIVTNYALANPDVAVALEHDGRETFATSGQGSLKETVMAVYGREVAESMIDVEPEELPDGPLSDVSGLVSDPETTRAGRDYLATFVNGRYVRSNVARDAVVEAYGTQLAPDRYPFAVLDLDLPAGQVDVNVHPRKLEVRFADESGLREQVRTAVETALLDAGLVRSSAPRGRSAPEQTEIDPSGPSGDEAQRPDHSDDESVTPTEGMTSADDPSDGTASSDDGAAGETGATDETVSTDTAARRGTDSPSTGHRDSGDAVGGRDRAPSSDAQPEGTRPASQTPEADDRSGDGSVGGDVATTSRRSDRTERGDNGGTSFDSPLNPAESRLRDSGKQTTFGDDEPLDRSFDSLPRMRILGQFRETYIVAEAETGLVLVDQHAADERINYERLRDAFDGDTTTQVLAQPVELSLTAREAELFESFQPALERLGFSADRREDRTVSVTTVPTVIADAADPELLRDALASFVDSEDDPDGTVEAAADDLLADLACYPSITGNTSLTEGSIVDLLDRLDACENPYACPHGRPVLIEIDADELADRFERDYPGHTTRRFD